MTEKLFKFVLTLDYLRDAVTDLEEWSDEYSGIFSKEINDLFYVINSLECYLDDLIHLEKENEKNEKREIEKKV